VTARAGERVRVHACVCECVCVRVRVRVRIIRPMTIGRCSKTWREGRVSAKKESIWASSVLSSQRSRGGALIKDI